jgi:glycine cleavage system regulatory protein
MLKKTHTISVEVSDNLNGIREISRVLMVHKIELLDLNILQYPMKGCSKIMIKVQSKKREQEPIGEGHNIIVK